MIVQELKKCIQDNNIPNFLIFTGEEYAVQKIYINQISKVLDFPVKSIDSISDIWGVLNSKSLFNKNYIYLLYNDKEFMTNEKIYKNIENILGNSILILVLTTADKRLKILKQYNSSIVEFNVLKSDILKRYIQREIPLLSDRNCEILMEICDYNYGHCLLEIDKINRYWRITWEQRDVRERDGGMFWINECFKTLLEDGTIYIPPRDNIWNFIKVILKNKPLEAYELWQELKELNIPVMSILFNLYLETKHVLQVQTCESKDVERVTGLTKWQINNAKECVGIFSSEDLEYLIRTIQHVESGIKRGLIEEDIAVDYILTNFL